MYNSEKYRRFLCELTQLSFKGKLGLLELQQMTGTLVSYLQLNVSMLNMRENALNFPRVIIQSNTFPKIQQSVCQQHLGHTRFSQV